MSESPSESLGRKRSAQLARASLRTAAGTLASRITGLLRLIVLAYALGGKQLADAFNLANNTPNIIHDLVLGGVLAATFIPVFVDNLARRERSAASSSISAVITLSFLLLVFTTILFVLFAPQIIALYTFGAHNATEQHVAVELLRFFAPQLLFYGAISLMSAVLATEDRFAIVGVVPILNNVVGIIIFAIFAAITHSGSGDLLVRVANDAGLMSLLGLGMTAGVALQALALLGAMRKLQIRLRPVWRPRDPAVLAIISLSGWTFGFVLANQLAVFIVLALAFHVGNGAVSAYTYAYIFFQLPFGVVAVSVTNVATPDMVRSFGLGHLSEMGKRFGTATRQILVLILPAGAGYLILANPVVALLLQHGAEHFGQATETASVLAMFALGLPGFCIFFLAIRAFQAMQDTRSAFFLYLLENGTNIVVAFLLYRSLGAKGLALSYSVAYTLAAIVAVLVLRKHLGGIGGHAMVRSLMRSGALSIVMAVVVAFVAALIGTGSGLAGWLKLFVALGAGIVVYIGAAGAAASFSPWQNSRREKLGPSTAKGGGNGRHQDRH